MYFVFLYENRTVKFVEIILRRGRRRMKKNDGGVNVIKIHC
jgi:hypothetical protein